MTMDTSRNIGNTVSYQKDISDPALVQAAQRDRISILRGT